MSDIGPAKFPVDNDILRTSTGVGHHWRPGYYFPDDSLKVLFVLL